MMFDMIMSAMRDLAGKLSFSGGGSGDGGNGSDGSRNVNKAEQAVCFGIGASAGFAAGAAVTGATKSPATGAGVGGTVGYAVRDACIDALSTSADYEGMMTAP